MKRTITTEVNVALPAFFKKTDVIITSYYIMIDDNGMMSRITEYQGKDLTLSFSDQYTAPETMPDDWQDSSLEEFAAMFDKYINQLEKIAVKLELLENKKVIESAQAAAMAGMVDNGGRYIKPRITSIYEPAPEEW